MKKLVKVEPTTSNFVTPVSTIILAVTLPLLPYASSIPTKESTDITHPIET